jgi:ABC-type polysaccharide/polyol phosphate export permease
MTLKSRVYDSAKRRSPALEELRDLIRFRDLIVQLVRRDVVTRYKRSVLGILWTMLNPLGTMIILSIVFAQMFDMRWTYPAFILTNLVAWNFFAQTTSASLSGMLWGSMLFQRIYLPRTAFVVSSIGTGLVNVFFSLVPLFLILLFTKVPLTITLTLLPVAILFLAAFSLGVSLIISTFVAFFPDVAEMYPILLTAWMYLTPIIYPEALLADVFNGWFLTYNPVYPLIKVFRMLVFDGLLPSGNEFLVAAGISFGTLLIGWVLFTKRSEKFAYYV